jgi:hypothetical protein
MPSKPHFDVKTFFAKIGRGRKILVVRKKRKIYTQGQKGKVKLTVISKAGKEATIAILNTGDFFGEGGLAGQTHRIGSAEAVEDCELMQIEKDAMLLALHQENKLADMFVSYLLGRNIRYEEDLVDQLFNSSEKRLARILLLLARFGKEGKPERAIARSARKLWPKWWAQHAPA